LFFNKFGTSCGCVDYSLACCMHIPTRPHRFLVSSPTTTSTWSEVVIPPHLPLRGAARVTSGQLTESSPHNTKRSSNIILKTVYTLYDCTHPSMDIIILEVDEKQLGSVDSSWGSLEQSLQCIRQTLRQTTVRVALWPVVKPFDCRPKGPRFESHPLLHR